MSQLEVFVQGEGISKIILTKVPRDGKVRDLLTAQGMSAGVGDTPVIFLEDGEEPLNLDSSLSAAGIKSRSRIHIHHCRRVEVSVNYVGRTETRPFSPAITIHRVKQWAVRIFGLTELDATEHVLQICGSFDRPTEDTHIGSLVTGSNCMLCFDLIPKQRIEG